MNVAKPKNTEIPDRLVIRSWPKMIFFVPTAITALLMGLATYFQPDYKNLWGGIFAIVLGLNLMIITFEFPRGTSLTLTISIVAVVLLVLLINQQYNLIPFLSSLVPKDIHCSAQFYYFVFLVYLALAVAMYVHTRFDFWELEANEIIHHSGILGDIERFPTAGVKFNKEITDVFEYMILGSGRLILIIPSAARPVVLDNILNINRTTELADRVMESRLVRVDQLAHQQQQQQLNQQRAQQQQQQDLINKMDMEQG